MPWWGWIVVGVALLVSETIVDAEFFLIFLGISALAVGALQLAGLDAAVWVQWLVFAALSAVSLVFFRRQLHRYLRTTATPIDEGMANERGVALDAIEPGAFGRAELRGTVWRVRNGGPEAIEAGTSIRVQHTDGIVLDVRREA
jgi:membrane protein implicated in regulation of membrane protease activity